MVEHLVNRNVILSTSVQMTQYQHLTTYCASERLTGITYVPRQVVLEGERVNVAVSGPAATLALALQFLRTNDATVAASFELPHNAHTLDLVRFVGTSWACQSAARLLKCIASDTNRLLLAAELMTCLGQ